MLHIFRTTHPTLVSTPYCLNIQDDDEDVVIAELGEAVVEAGWEEERQDLQVKVE